MPNAANVQFNIKNFTPGVSTPQPGIFYVLGLTKRGPVEQPDLEVSLIRSWPQFERTFGGLMDTTDFPLLCKRALKRGAQLRVCNTDAASVAAVKATLQTISNATPEALFTCIPKYKGANYNNIIVDVQPASNGDTTSYWNLVITHDLEPELNELYENLGPFIVGTGGEANNQTCLDEVIATSKLLDFTYSDGSSGVGAVIPDETDAAVNFTGGVDASGHIAGDYSGALATFDGVDDGMIIAIPEQDDDTMNAAGITYAAARGDLVFFAHLPNSEDTSAALVTTRGAIASNSKYGGIYCGGIKLREEATLQEIEVSEMGDVLGIAAYVHSQFGEWYSLAGQSKGSVQDAIGVVNNFGTPGGFADLNALANVQVNAMVHRNSITQLSGNFSAQFANDQEKYLSVVFLVLWMKKTIKPILETYLEEPNDPITFQKIYYHLKPFLDKLASPAYRALYKYEYYGDQDANTIDDLQLNDPADVQNGKYRIDLKIWPIPSLQELTFNLMLVQGEGVYIQ